MLQVLGQCEGRPDVPLEPVFLPDEVIRGEDHHGGDGAVAGDPQEGQQQARSRPPVAGCTTSVLGAPWRASTSR